MRLALGEHRDQHIGAGHFLAARRLDVDGGALQHALETRRGLSILGMVRYEVAELAVDVGNEIATQFLQIDRAGAENRHRVLVFGQREEQMLERGIFVAPLVRISEGSVQGLFQIAR